MHEEDATRWLVMLEMFMRQSMSRTQTRNVFQVLRIFESRFKCPFTDAMGTSPDILKPCLDLMAGWLASQNVRITELLLTPPDQINQMMNAFLSSAISDRFMPSEVKKARPNGDFLARHLEQATDPKKLTPLLNSLMNEWLDEQGMVGHGPASRHIFPMLESFLQSHRSPHLPRTMLELLKCSVEQQKQICLWAVQEGLFASPMLRARTQHVFDGLQNFRQWALNSPQMHQVFIESTAMGHATNTAIRYATAFDIFLRKKKKVKLNLHDLFEADMPDIERQTFIEDFVQKHAQTLPISMDASITKERFKALLGQHLDDYQARLTTVKLHSISMCNQHQDLTPLPIIQALINGWCARRIQNLTPDGNDGSDEPPGDDWLIPSFFDAEEPEAATSESDAESMNSDSDLFLQAPWQAANMVDWKALRNACNSNRSERTHYESTFIRQHIASLMKYRSEEDQPHIEALEWDSLNRRELKAALVQHFLELRQVYNLGIKGIMQFQPR